MVLFCSSHFPHPQLLLSLSKLNSPSLYTLIYLKNGFSHSLFNPLYSLQTLSIGPLFMFSLIFFQNKNPHLLLQFCFLHTQNTQFAFIFSNSHFSLFPSLLTSSWILLSKTQQNSPILNTDSSKSLYLKPPGN